MKTEAQLKLDPEYTLDAYRDGKFEFSFSFTKTIPEDEQARLAKEYTEAINNHEQLSALQQENDTLKAELKEMSYAGITPGLLDKPINFPVTQKNKELRAALQLALQENEKLRERLKKYEPCPF